MSDANATGHRAGFGQKAVQGQSICSFFVRLFVGSLPPSLVWGAGTYMQGRQGRQEPMPAERRPAFPREACTHKETRRRRCQPCNKLRGVPQSSVTAWSQRSRRNCVELKVISPRLKTHYLGITCPWEISALSSSPGPSKGRCPVAPTISSPSSPSLCLTFHCTCCQTVWIYPRPGSPSATCFCSPPGKPVSRGQGPLLFLLHTPSARLSSQ